MYRRGKIFCEELSAHAILEPYDDGAEIKINLNCPHAIKGGEGHLDHTSCELTGEKCNKHHETSRNWKEYKLKKS